MWSKGISWIDDCRIPWQNEDEFKFIKSEIARYGYDPNTNQNEDWKGIRKIGNVSKEQGRFPANILVSDDMLNDGVISKSKSGGISSGVNFGGETTKFRDRIGHDDKGTNSRYYDIDKWFDKIINYE